MRSCALCPRSRMRLIKCRTAIHTPGPCHPFTCPYVWIRIVVCLFTRARVASCCRYNVFTRRPCLPFPSQRSQRVTPRDRVVGTCLFEFLHDSVLLARGSPLPSMREKCAICGKLCQTSGLSNHLRRCKGPRGVHQPGSKKRLRPGLDALREPAKIARRENRRAESRERQEIRDLVNEVRPHLRRVCYGF